MVKFYSKAILCFCLLCVSFFSQAQITPFNTSSKDKIGFLKGNGDTLYQAQFVNVQTINLAQEGNDGAVRKVWIVERNKKMGCIDESGKWIVDCLYDIIYHCPETPLFLVRKESTSGVYNTLGEVVIPFEYSELTYRNEKGIKSFLAVKNNLRTVFDANGKIIIPESGSIRQFKLNSIDPKKTPTYIYEYGYYDQKCYYSRLKDGSGNDISPKDFQRMYFLDFEFGYVEDEQLCIVSDLEGNQALAHFDGKPLTVYFDKSIDIRPVEYIAPNTALITYRNAILSISDDEEQVLNIKTGNLSAIYEEIEVFGDYFIATSDNAIFVLNSETNVVFQTKLKSKRLCYFDEDNNRAREVGRLLPWELWERGGEVAYIMDFPQFLDQMLDEILVIVEEVEASKAEQNHGIYQKMRCQLVQTRTGKLIEKEYDDVLRAISNKGIFVWAMKTTKDSLLVDIYSFDGNFIRSLSFPESQADQVKAELSKIRTEDEYKIVDASIWISNAEGKYKGFHHNGMALTNDYTFSENAQFVYSDMKSRHILREPLQEYYKYYDQSHSPLYADDYYSDTIDLGSNGYYLQNVFHYRTSWDSLGLERGGLIFDRDFKLNLVCDSVYYKHESTELNVLKVKENPYHIFYKNHCYYVLTNGKLKVLDSTMFVNPSSINKVPGIDEKVDSNGRIYRGPSPIKSNNRSELFVPVLMEPDQGLRRMFTLTKDVV